LINKYIIVIVSNLGHVKLAMFVKRIMLLNMLQQHYN
jgi:hypothetical protein